MNNSGSTVRAIQLDPKNKLTWDGVNGISQGEEDGVNRYIKIGF